MVQFLKLLIFHLFFQFWNPCIILLQEFEDGSTVTLLTLARKHASQVIDTLEIIDVGQNGEVERKYRVLQLRILVDFDNQNLFIKLVEISIFLGV